ncbi:Sec20-domain-containing protein [Guyanagaster necrorhizus]|uniref:Sec20-domain-containing protein n=1 Tax=Guyanagaster necrorhizus TaxID=856835 RepID=A0A9P7VY17_9AGAR|nr:Sec20-domain-containing protein [Guyanagaster necrorhizus MCA 3950]KAG7448662.1 Sec20-domain-containing protein [Guyanagaster necrorhizus MCA 3950]
MPPIPSTFDEEISQTIASVERRQNDISQFQIPRLCTCKGPLRVQQNLAAELREDLDAIARQVEGLDLLVGDQRGEKNRRELQQIVDRLKSVHSSLRKDTRAALLESKRAIDALSRSSREELLKSSAVTEKSNEKVTEDALMQANDTVTEAFRRTIGLMQVELERSVASTQLLDASSASLRATSSTHDTLTNIMDTSKQLITALEKTDWIDRVLIISGLVFFALVVLLILKQRLVDRGIRIAFWWTRFIPDFGSDEALVSMEEGIKATTLTTTLVSVAASSVSAAISSLSVSSVVEVAISNSLWESSATDPATETIASLTNAVIPTTTDTIMSPATEDSHDEL